MLAHQNCAIAGFGASTGIVGATVVTMGLMALPSMLRRGYDPAFARCRPGHLLLLQTLSRAAGQGLRSCEFMGHAAPWTAQWTDTLRACVGVRVYPLSLPGLHAWAEDGADGLRRRIDALRRGAE